MFVGKEQKRGAWDEGACELWRSLTAKHESVRLDAIEIFTHIFSLLILDNY